MRLGPQSRSTIHTSPPSDKARGVLPAPHAGRRDRLVTVSVLLLLVALLIPVPTVSASGPVLRVSGVATAGRRISVVGAGFGPRVRLQLRWDGRSAGMPVVRTDSRGLFSTSLIVPARATVGTHKVSAVLAGKATLRTRTLAVRTIRVIAAHAGPPTSPTPTPTSALVPGVASTTTPTPTPTPTSSLVISAVSAYDITQTGATITWTVSAPATGQVEYGTTSAYGSLSLPETSFTYTTHIQTLSGLAPGTLYHYRTHSVDAAGNVAYSADDTFTTLSTATLSTATPTPTPTPTSAPAPASGPVYGSGLNADTLANIQVGGTDGGGVNTAVAYRFRATTSSALTSIRIYIIGTVSGYAAGTGGTLQISVQTDDGSADHVPSGTALASVSIPNAASLEGAGTVISFPSPATLAAGQLYHIVFRNTDPSPSVNFVSVDDTFVYGSTLVPGQPLFSDTDFAVLMNQGTWARRSNFTPILNLVYANGQIAGMGYMEVWIRDYALISGSAQARETFTLGAGRTVSSAAVRLRRTSGSSPLVVRLERSDGTLIDQASVPASSIPASAPGGDNGGAVWATVTFPASHALAPGAYNLVLTTTSDTAYTIFSIRKGLDYGYAPTSYFADGEAQYTTGGGWAPFAGRAGESDLQFYLR